MWFASGSEPALRGRGDWMAALSRATWALASGVVAWHCGTSAVAGEVEPLVIHQDFAIAASHPWTTVAISRGAGVWHVGGRDGPVASRAELDAVFTSLRSAVVGVRCQGVLQRSTYYPCHLDLQAGAGHRRSDLSIEALDGWFSTTGRLLRRYGEGIVTAVSTPDPPSMPAWLHFGHGDIGLVASSALLADTRSKVIRFRVRVTTSPAAGAKTAVPTTGFVMLSSSPIVSPIVRPGKPEPDGSASKT